MTALQETKIEVGADHPTILDRWPEETITFMGRSVINLAALRYRNSQIMNACLETTTDVGFSTFEDVLIINDLTKRFSSSVAHLLSCLVVRETGLQPNEKLRDIIAKTNDITINSAGGVMSEALQALRYWRFDSKGALIYTVRGFTGLRDDLVFLPQDTETSITSPNISAKMRKKSITPKPVIPSEPYLKIRTILSTGQQYIAWWQDHILGNLKPSEDNSQELFTKVIYSYDQPQLELETITELAKDESGNSEESLNKTETNTIQAFRTTDEFIQIAMTAAFDYFFHGGVMPIATDITTFNAFQKAIQELGGYESTEFSGPVAKLYLGTSEAALTTEVRRRIKALGESIHTERPREVNMRTVTPSENLSNASKGWMKDGACHGLEPDIFHPDEDAKDDSPDVLAAKAICEHCIVKSECLEFALDTKQKDGVWGGLTERERRVLIRRRQRQALKD